MNNCETLKKSYNTVNNVWIIFSFVAILMIVATIFFPLIDHITTVILGALFGILLIVEGSISARYIRCLEKEFDKKD